MKILFVGDYSNLHATLAKELSKRGNEVTVISDKGGFMGTHADIYLKREHGVLGGIRYLYQLFNLLPDLKAYDVVQFINPNFFNLKPGKIKYFFDRLKDQNGKTFLTLAGNDYFYCKACLDGNLFRFSEFKIGNDFTEFHKENPNLLYGWTNYVNRSWNEYFYDKIDGAMSVLPEYDMVARQIIPDKTIFTNLPIDIESLPVTYFQNDKPVKLFLGIKSGMEKQKGTKELLKIAKEIEVENPENVRLDFVRDLPFNLFQQKMSQSDIVLDQLYAYSPATTALIAMGMGKVAASGGQQEFYDYIGNPIEKPVLSLSPFDKDIKEKLLTLIFNSHEIEKRGRASRKLVEKNNDVSIVADKFVNHWQK